MDMDAAAQTVERNLAETSRNCNSRLLERKARNLKMFEERVGAAGMYSGGVVGREAGRADDDDGCSADREKYVFAAQLAVLQSCPAVVSRLLHKDRGVSCLLATKVFVVSRLLLKSLLQKVSAILQLPELC